MAKQPNILWVMTDEHRVDAFGCYGSRRSVSPNIDSISQSGVRFEHCTAQSPMCIPSRTADVQGKGIPYGFRISTHFRHPETEGALSPLQGLQKVPPGRSQVWAM